MSKKHFIAIGECLRMHRLQLERTMPDTAERDRVFDALLADVIGTLKRTNPNFMSERFRNFVAGQCGPNGGKVKA